MEQNRKQINFLFIKIDNKIYNLSIGKIDKSTTYGHLIFDKKGKMYNGEKTISLTSGPGKTGQPRVKE